MHYIQGGYDKYLNMITRVCNLKNKIFYRKYNKIHKYFYRVWIVV